MRFISPYERFRIVVKHQQVEILASGQPRVLAPGFTAEFRNSDITDFERDLARKSFSFRGTLTTKGGVPIDPMLSRVSSFDTGSLSEPLRSEVDQFLTTHVDYGRDFIVSDRPKLAPPWPSYDKEKAGEIAKKALDLGFDPDVVIAYERENKNRPSVIEALTPVPEVEEELVTA